jgi:endopeptidase La
MPDNVKMLALEKIEEMKTSNNEYYKQQLFVKTLCKFPWISKEDDIIYEDLKNNIVKSQQYLDNIEKKLEETVFGHSNAKKDLKELVGKWIANPKSSGSAIGLVGPPGVGKTLFAKGISKALGVPFAQIALGGQNDGEILYGHGYTYSGSQPGMIVKKMIEAGSSRCVLFFDELDKTASKHGATNEIMSILIHLTDPNMNSQFQDRFFQGIDFPLNKVLMIFSYNDRKLIDNILLDRLKEIPVEAYTTQEKIQITENYMIKEISDVVGYEHGSVLIKNDEKDSDIEYIIENYTLEAGVRELKRCIEKIFLKLNIDRIYCKNLFEKNNPIFTKEKPIVIDRETIIKYLDKPQLNIEQIHNESQVGVINGLYASSVGKGGIVPIQIFKNEAGFVEHKFMLKLTGSQKKVMKESIIVALTTAINQLSDANKERLLKEFPYGFHIHTPDGATPKDGPSAGCAFTTAFVSRILNKKIKNTIAMTGEIELTGRVTKIGGLLYKLNGAKKAGVTDVYCSIENKEDFNKIAEKNNDLLSDTFRVHFVVNIKEILRDVIIDIEDSDIAQQ